MPEKKMGWKFKINVYNHNISWHVFSDFENILYDQNDFVEGETIKNEETDECPVDALSIVDEAFKANYENRMVRNANKNCQAVIFHKGAEVFLRKDVEGFRGTT